MVLNTPENASEIFKRMSVDVSSELNNLDPFLKNSYVRSLLVAYANANFELYKTLEQAINETFWDTATGTYLERWAAIYGKTRNAATKATGYVTFTGIDTTVIPLGSQFTSESGSFYSTTSAGTITATDLSVSTMTRVGSTVFVQTSSNHGLASNMSIVISGANETDYNGTYKIIVTGLNTFQYSISATPASPATGTILASANYANINSESDNFGADQNLENGSKITLATPIAGVDNVGYVSFDELSGGTDEESDDDLRDRFLFRVQNPIALFNNNAIEDKAKEVSGVTRVWVQNVDYLDGILSASSLVLDGTNFAIFTTATPHGLNDGQPISVNGANETEYNVNNEKITVISTTSFAFKINGTPSSPATGTITASYGVSNLGQVRIFFVRDNDTNIIPSPGEVTDVKNAILTIKPAPTSDSDVIVLAPTPVIVNFTFSSITPDTTDMRTAIEDSLNSFFSQGTNVAKDVQQVEYESAIINTVDSAGNRLQAFTLTLPVGNISVNSGELAILGTITF